eukprot:1075061-Pleurochrysis_carterae.AAC.12
MSAGREGEARGRGTRLVWVIANGADWVALRRRGRIALEALALPLDDRAHLPNVPLRRARQKGKATVGATECTVC